MLWVKRVSGGPGLPAKARPQRSAGWSLTIAVHETTSFGVPSNTSEAPCVSSLLQRLSGSVIALLAPRIPAFTRPLEHGIEPGSRAAHRRTREPRPPLALAPNRFLTALQDLSLRGQTAAEYFNCSQTQYSWCVAWPGSSPLTNLAYIPVTITVNHRSQGRRWKGPEAECHPS